MPQSRNPDARHFTLKLAENEAELIAAQRLRYRVFVAELGAKGSNVDHVLQREQDEFDAYYDHLILIDRRIDPASLDHVVGVYRLMKGEVAKKGPGFYTASEYELSALNRSGKNLLELGRSCVDARHRGGVAVYLLWNGLADYVLRNDIELLFGVASYHGTDISKIAQSLAYLNQNHLAPVDLRVRVKPEYYQSLDLVAPEKISEVEALAETPALIKAYLRLGGFIGDGAFIDRNFNTVDVCLMMDTVQMSQRHRLAYTRKASAVAAQ